MGPRREDLRLRHLFAVVAVAAIFFRLIEAVESLQMAAHYRKIAEQYRLLLQRSRDIEAMDPAARAREAILYPSETALADPDWNRRVRPRYAAMIEKYEYAAEHPRISPGIDPEPPP